MKSRLLFASFLVEGVIQTTTGYLAFARFLSTTFYRGRNGLSPQRVFSCIDLVAAVYHIVLTLSRLAMDDL